MSALNETDRVRARYHLGYLNVQEASTFQLGVPAAVPTLFMIEGAMNRLIPEAVPRIIMLLDRLDAVECELFGGIDLVSYKQMESITVNEKRFTELSKYYRQAMQSLASALGCLQNPYDPREWANGGGVNISIQH